MVLEYITNREIADKSGDVRGRVKIMKVREEPDATVELTCPSCGKVERKKEPWKAPFVTGEKKDKKFLVGCKCGFNAVIINLERQAKKDAKASKK